MSKKSDGEYLATIEHPVNDEIMPHVRTGKFPALRARLQEELGGLYSRQEQAVQRLIAVAKAETEMLEDKARQAQEEYEANKGFMDSHGS